MKVKVISENESVIYKCEVYKFNEEFEMDEAIAEGLIQRGYVKAVTDEAAVVTGHFDAEDLEAMKYQELRKLAKDIGVDASGTKEEIIKRLCEEDVELPFSDIEFVSDDEAEEGIELPNTGMPE